MTTNQLAHNTILAKVNEVIAMARRIFPDYTHNAPIVCFDLRGRSCGGLALGHIKLTFNLDWYTADPVNYLNAIVPHEVAHIVASATGRGKGHNMGWKRIDRALGGNGSRCSAVGKTVERARSATEYLYINTVGREVWIGPVHHKRMQSKARIAIALSTVSRYVLQDRTGAKIHHDSYQGVNRERT